jgi:shikimate dehydrogenase
MQAATARGLKVVGGVEMIKHQLPLQTAFWRGEGSEQLHSRK